MECPHNRIFPRYRLDQDFVLNLAGKKVNAYLADLSIDGFGVVIHGITGSSASLVEIRIDAIDVEASGKIVWSRNFASGTRLGIRRTSPLKGDVRNCRAADLLLGIQKMGKTGVLQLQTPSSIRDIYFRNGRLIFATSDNEEREVGEILLRTGKINPVQYDRSLQLVSKSGKNQVAALLELGYIKPEDIVPAVRSQAEEVLLGLFTLDQGMFIFNEGPLPLKRLVALTFNTADLIYRGAKARADTEKIRTLYRAKESIVCLDRRADDYLQAIQLGDHEKRVIELMEHERTMHEVISLSPLNESETLRILYALQNAQVVEIIETGAGSRLFDGERESGTAENELESVYKIEKLYGEFKSLGYQGVLNVGRDTPPEEIKRSYYKMAREYHPDSHLQLSSDSVREKLNVIFSYINEAYRALISSHNHGQGQGDPQTDNGGVSYKQMAGRKFEAGMSYFSKGLFDQAMTYFGQAAHLDGSVPDYHYYYGLTLFHTKRIRDAEASIRKAFQLSPSNADYIAELGHIYLGLGFETRARNAFEKALKFSPSHQRASAGLKKCLS